MEVRNFSNSLGSVSEQKVVLHHKNASEEIPFSHITSVSFERKSNKTLAIIYFFAGVVCAVMLATGALGFSTLWILIGVILTILIFIVGLAYWFGYHAIVISTAGRDRKPLKIEMAKTREGRELYEAIQGTLFVNR